MWQTIEKKYVLVPDCDDDRYVWPAVDNGFRGHRQPRNPRHIREQARVYFTGKPVWNPEEGCFLKEFSKGDMAGFWSPAMTLEWKDGQLQQVDYEVAWKNPYKKFLAGFLAVLYFVEGENTYRISLYGGDDTSYQRYDLSPQKAQNIWKRINHHITIKTIRRLGFHAE